jgi:hypothetical protein
MRIHFRLLVVAAAAAALFGAPAAAADPDCTTTGGTTTCSSPGNVEVNASPTTGDEPFTLPYWDEAFGGGGSYPGPYPVPYDEGSGEIGAGHR